MHVPTLKPVTVEELTEHLPEVALTIVTVSPLDEVAESDCDALLAKEDG